MSKEQIQLTIAGKDVSFVPNVMAYNKYINEITMNNKVSPAHNFLMRIVTPETKEALETILALPGAALQVVGKVLEEYTPELEITVKN
ncbi:Protein of uncharacterised function (DUF2765) [Klebsiella variicola]|uniref:putative phage tail assembly chaperone n=1 Tax=Klebsiella variicola TaxID=244366 RepID=UPI000D74CFFB|nr:putative phage tail assembly chaperone [Klebsiella variicola]PXH33318.1 hypothetical protein DMR13_13030 [Klebsiella variicola]SXD75595.1 Protein of uncharacterised function (DUF2765) [Klebsiella variicola]HCT8728677.1 putative phage tail assembly chaperone [Klebsiella pneumoniae]